MIIISLVTKPVLIVECYGQIFQPAEIVVRRTSPEYAWVLPMCRPVRRIETLTVQRRAQDLHTLQDHLHHVFIAVVSRTSLDTCIQYEYVHTFQPLITTCRASVPSAAIIQVTVRRANS